LELSTYLIEGFWKRAGPDAQRHIFSSPPPQHQQKVNILLTIVWELLMTHVHFLVDSGSLYELLGVKSTASAGMSGYTNPYRATLKMVHFFSGD
jgi:hypothetical protein